MNLLFKLGVFTRLEIRLSYVTNSKSEHELEKELKQGKFEAHFVGISIQVSDCRYQSRFDPCVSLWSSLDLTIATDSLSMFQIIFLVSCPVSWGPSHTSSWCHLERATWLTWSSQDCKGATFLHESFSKSCRLLVPVGAIEGLLSLWSATAGRLCVPASITLTIGQWESAVFSPTAWNYLRVDLWVFQNYLAILGRK